MTTVGEKLPRPSPHSYRPIVRWRYEKQANYASGDGSYEMLIRIDEIHAHKSTNNPIYAAAKKVAKKKSENEPGTIPVELVELEAPVELYRVQVPGIKKRRKENKKKPSNFFDFFTTPLLVSFPSSRRVPDSVLPVLAHTILLRFHVRDLTSNFLQPLPRSRARRTRSHLPSCFPLEISTLSLLVRACLCPLFVYGFFLFTTWIHPRSAAAMRTAL